MKRRFLFVLLLTIGARQGAAQKTRDDRQSRPSGLFGGIEAGLIQFGNAHFNGPSGAFRLGSALDPHGLVRAGVILRGAGADEAYVMGLGFLELRPLSPHRFTPLLGISGGILQVIEAEAGQNTSGIGLLTAGVTIRIGQARIVTIRAEYGDSYKRSGFYSLQAGLEFGH